MGHLFLLVGCVSSSGPQVLVHTQGGSVEVRVEVAATENERKQGLMGWTDLPDGRGMLFIFEPGTRPAMWMKNMRIPLDIVFISSGLKILDIAKDVQPCLPDDYCPTIASESGSRYVLELPAGFAEKKGLRPGDQVELLGLTRI